MVETFAMRFSSTLRLSIAAKTHNCLCLIICHFHCPAYGSSYIILTIKSYFEQACLHLKTVCIMLFFLRYLFIFIKRLLYSSIQHHFLLILLIKIAAFVMSTNTRFCTNYILLKLHIGKPIACQKY